MEPLQLDPIDYTGSYKLIGGRPSLDLVNTISWPGTEREHDWLTTPANVSDWLGAAGLNRWESDDIDVDEIHEVRLILTEVLRPLAERRHPAPAAIERLNHLLAESFGRRQVDPHDLTWTWQAPRRAVCVLDPVILDAADVVTRGRKRLKHCPSCHWLFEDQTRNGGRRWCDMADCGSRSKARNYYHRQKGAET